jgi:hypothetical protein
MTVFCNGEQNGNDFFLYFRNSYGVFWAMEILTPLATSWPFWISLVIVLALILFRNDLSDLIKRIRRIGKDHIDATGVQEQQAQTPVDPRQAADELLAQVT